MEKFFELKLRELAKEPRVVDAGGGHPFQKRMARYRDLFANTKYDTLDSSPRYNPTIAGDIHNLPFADASVPAILCISTFEHIEDPKRAAEEIYRVLKPGGKLLLFTHFIYPYHARRGVYGDTFRFTDEGLKFLFRQFSSIELKKQGGWFRAMLFFTPLQQYTRPLWEPIAYLLDKFFKTEKRSTTVGYYVYAVK